MRTFWLSIFLVVDIWLNSYAQDLNLLVEEGLAYYQQHNYKEAIRNFEKARETLLELYGKENEEYATLSGILGGLYLKEGNYDKAQVLVEEAKLWTEKLMGKRSVDYARMCYALSTVYNEQARYAESESLLKEALTIEAELLGKQHIEYIKSLSNLGTLYKKLDRYPEAEQILLEVKEIVTAKLGKENDEYATVCNSLGGLYTEMSQYSKAELLLKESLAIYEKIFGKEHPDYLVTLKNLASLYKKQGNYAQAIVLYDEILPVERRMFGENHLDYAATYNNLGELYERLYDYSQAELFYKKASDIILEKLGENHPMYASICNNLGGLYADMGNYDQAEYFYRISIEVRKKVYGEWHMTYAQSCNNLAFLYLKQNRYDEAEPFLLKSRDIILRTLGKKHAVYADFADNLGFLYCRKGDYAKGIAFYKESTETYFHQIQMNFVGLSEKEKERYLATFKYMFEIFFSFSLSLSDPSINEWLLENNLMTKGLLFFSTYQLRRALEKSSNASLQKLYEQWITQRKQLAVAYQVDAQTLQQKRVELEALEKQANETEKQLSQHLEKAGIKATLAPTKHSWKEIQKKLQPKEALVELTRVRYYQQGWTDSVLYVALIVKKDSQYPERVVLPNGSQLEKEHAAYYRNMTRFKMQDRQSYQVFFEPFKEVLKDIERVYFSADGVYHQINLATLYNPQTKKYLLEEVDIHLVSTARDFLELTPKARRKRFADYRLFLVGYPDFSGGTAAEKIDEEKEETSALVTRISENQRFFDSELGTISTLPATKTEIQQIETIARKAKAETQVFLSSEASEENLKSLSSPDILHIATHGFFIPVKKQEQEYALKTTDYDNPLLRSGLLLAGAELAFKKQAIAARENGILTAQEAMNLDLRQTELVVLSACETGLGEIKNGEGVFGLQRALQEAGAKSVLMSLWKVDDTATQEMMGLFYENLLLRKQDKRTAFRNAQQAMKQKYESPYYWGAFVMVGE